MIRPQILNSCSNTLLRLDPGILSKYQNPEQLNYLSSFEFFLSVCRGILCPVATCLRLDTQGSRSSLKPKMDDSIVYVIIRISSQKINPY